MVKTQKMMKITTQKVILTHIMHQDASESKNKNFWKSKMASILPKYGQNPGNDENNHTEGHFSLYYAPGCLGIQKREVLKIQDDCHIAQIW